MLYSRIWHNQYFVIKIIYPTLTVEYYKIKVDLVIDKTEIVD